MKNKDFLLNISSLCLYAEFTLNRLIKMSTDCSVDLIFMQLAAQ